MVKHLNIYLFIINSTRHVVYLFLKQYIKNGTFNRSNEMPYFKFFFFFTKIFLKLSVDQ